MTAHPTLALREPSLPLIDLLIVGAGPAGLSTAIAAKQAGFTYRVIEKGTVVNSIFRFPRHMVFFSTPERLEIGGLPFTAAADRPTRLEALRYFRRVVDSHQLAISLNEEVVYIKRESMKSVDELAFIVGTSAGDHLQRCYRARAVVLAIGYFDHPRLLNVPGEDLPGVSHYYDEPNQYFHRSVVVVGGGNSAVDAALDLCRSGAHVTLVHRGASLVGIKHWVKPEIEQRLKDGSIAGRFNTSIVRILPSAVITECQGQQESLLAEKVFLLTGYMPDLGFLRSVGVLIEEEGCVPHYETATLETNVPGLFVAGGILSRKGCRPIFIEDGRNHGEQIVGLLRQRRIAQTQGVT